MSDTSLDRTQLDEKGIERVAALLSVDDAVRSPDVFFDLDSQVGRDGIERFARRVVEAYLTEPPPWPTEESMDAYAVTDAQDSGVGACDREALRAAMLADPIIQAAIKLRDQERQGPGARLAYARVAVVDAVIEAGL